MPLVLRLFENRLNASTTPPLFGVNISPNILLIIYTDTDTDIQLKRDPLSIFFKLHTVSSSLCEGNPSVIGTKGTVIRKVFPFHDVSVVHAKRSIAQ